MVDMYTTDAWVLHKGTANAGPGHLELESISFPRLDADEVLVEPLFGSWEGNMAHAVERSPVDICALRNEPHVVGYLITVHGYDAPGTIGLLAKKTKAVRRNLIPLPAGTRFSLPQWAVFSLRYMTAWSNWSTAYACLRSQLSEEELPTPFVWGWGGGCTFAELDLAQRAGCAAVMLSGNDQNTRQIEEQGIAVVDRRSFPDLDFDPVQYKADEAYREAYRSSERKFLSEVMERTAGSGVSIFIDYIGSPVSRATTRALGRQGVLATAGWKHGLTTPLNRAMECIGRHIYVHTHAARLSEVAPAMTYAEQHGWMPPVNSKDVYGFDDVPQLVADYSAGRTGYFPVYQVNE